MKTGLFGGTFDPIHIGHLIVAEDVREKLALDRIVFIPARHPWLKSDREITDAGHRLEMVRLAIGGNPYFELWETEVHRSGPSYTVDTVAEARLVSPPEEEIYFIAGIDAVSDMPRWKDPGRIVTLCQIIAVRRPGASEIDPANLKPNIPEIASCMRVIDVPQIDVSSTMIREWVHWGRSIRYLVPEAVERYIAEHGLYSA